MSRPSLRAHLGLGGSVQVVGTLPQALSSADIAEVRVTVSAADM